MEFKTIKSSIVESIDKSKSKIDDKKNIEKFKEMLATVLKKECGNSVTIGEVKVTPTNSWKSGHINLNEYRLSIDAKLNSVVGVFYKMLKPEVEFTAYYNLDSDDINRYVTGVKKELVLLMMYESKNGSNNSISLKLSL